MTAITIPRGELGSAEITSTATTTSATAAAVAGLSVTVTTGTRPIRVDFSGLLSNSVAANYTNVLLFEDGVQILNLGTYFATASVNIPCAGFARRTPSAGSHTYTVEMANTNVGGGTTTGTASILAGATYPATLEVTEI